MGTGDRFFAFAWYGEDMEVVEWDIVRADRAQSDPRVGDGAAKAVAAGGESGGPVPLGDGGMAGAGTDPRAASVWFAGPFASPVQAQVFVDCKMLPEEED